MTFEWDPIKAASNLRKHGIFFEVAKDVFSDPLAIIDPDDSDPPDERWRAIALWYLVCRACRACSRRHPHHLGQKGLAP
jgi:uncharacterized DUF497 family protein